MQVNFYRKFQDTEGLALFRCKASEVEQNAKAIEDNHSQTERETRENAGQSPESGQAQEIQRLETIKTTPKT